MSDLGKLFSQQSNGESFVFGGSVMSNVNFGPVSLNDLVQGSSERFLFRIHSITDPSFVQGNFLTKTMAKLSGVEPMTSSQQSAGCKRFGEKQQRVNQRE